MSKHRLLLADDSVTIQKVVNLTFADEGIEVISVGDGNSAMKKFVEATPDLVMVDVNMPGVDGYRICEMIKQDEETRHVPVILLVGSFEPFDEEEARRVGANDYLTKPFQSIRQLVNKVTILLNKSNGGEISARPEPSAGEEDAYAAPRRQEDEQQAQEEEPQRVSETITAITPEEDQSVEVFEALGDAGMDDEMIQASQIGSLPADEVQKFESGSGGFDADPLQNQLRNPLYEPSDGQDSESGGSFGKTQQYTAEEFEEIAAPAEENYQAPDSRQDYSAERISAEERAISLERQMVSEFESESESTVSESESQETAKFSFESDFPQPVAQDEVFMPEDVPSERQISVEEIPHQESFSVEDQPSGDFSDAAETAPQFQTGQDLAESGDKQEGAKNEESFERNYYSEPERWQIQEASEPGAFDETAGFPHQTDISGGQVSFEDEITAETLLEKQGEESAGQEASEDADAPQIYSESAQIPTFDSSETAIDEPETVSQQPTYFQDEHISEAPGNFSEPGRQIYEPENAAAGERAAQEDESFAESGNNESGKSYPVESAGGQSSADFEDRIESRAADSESLQAETESAEPELRYTDAEEEPSYTETEQQAQSVQEQESDGSEQSRSFAGEDEPEFAAEDSTPTVEIPAASPTIEEEPIPTAEEENPAQDEIKEENAEEKAPQVNSLVFAKEKSDAVESVIVSEFARHSISLSSEAVETIAARIAEKISDQIVEQLANDVVKDLADLIVERMERKKLE